MRNRTVVRVKKTVWVDDRGIHRRDDINILKRKSEGECLILDDAMDDANVFEFITNFDDIEDGIYEVVVVNGSESYWEYELRMFKED